MNPTKNRGELRRSWRVSSSCSASDTSRVTLITPCTCVNLAIFMNIADIRGSTTIIYCTHNVSFWPVLTRLRCMFLIFFLHTMHISDHFLFIHIICSDQYFVTHTISFWSVLIYTDIIVSDQFLYTQKY
jgi:hypothetical protein